MFASLKAAAASRRALALVFALSLVATACGQKEGIHVEAAGSNAGFTSGAADQSAAGAATPSGEAAPSASGASAGVSQTVQKTTSGGSTGGATGTGQAGAGTGGGTGGSGGGGGGGQVGSAQTRGTDTTGAGADKIVIAIHAPATGAAPLPTTSFEKYKDLYWRYITEIKGEKVLGRSKVEVLFRDDKYTPSSARQVCRELMSQAFLLVGGGGTDQVQACGDLANSKHVPYLSAGVTEKGLKGLPWYFATSMSYAQQADLLAQYVKKHFSGKSAMIATDTPNFDDAVSAWEAAVQKNGLPYYKTLRHPKGDTSWYNSYGSDLQSAGVKNIYFLSSPVDYLQFAQQNQGAHFQFMGVGVTQGLNATISTGCGDASKTDDDYIQGGVFFSPFPGVDWSDKNLPQIAQASEKLGLGKPDDLATAIWSINAGIHQVLLKYQATYGNKLTREDFRALLENQTNISTGVGPVLGYSPQNHFGAHQVHVLKADCPNSRYSTLETFKSGF